MTLTRLVRGIAVACAVASFAHAQTVQQAGPWAGGHVPSYQMGGGMSSPFVSDGGPAGGGARNPVQEQELVTPSIIGQLPPYAASGTGPLGANWCDYDGPLTSAAGYHFLCISPNSQGGGLIAYGAAGGATAGPLQFWVNGILYDAAQQLPSLVANSVLVTNTSQTLWSRTLPTGLSIDLSDATMCAISTCVSGLGAGVPAALGTAANATGGFPTIPVGVPQGGTGQTSLTANLPLLGNGTGPVAQGTRTGNTTTFATSTGTLTTGDCVSVSSGNFIDAGGPCTIGGGGGTVTAGTAGQTASYQSTGSTIVGIAPGAQTYTQSTNSTGVARTFQTKMDDWVSAKDYGAVGNNSTDDTTALQAWLTAIAAQGKCGYLPAGIYKITSGIGFPSGGAAKLCIHGSGQYVTSINYTGSSTTALIMQITCTSGSPCNQIDLEDFSITSGTVMTGGYGLSMDNVSFSSFRNLDFSTYISSNQNLYNGILFENSSWNNWVGGETYVSHYGVSAWAATTRASELSLDEMTFINNGDTAIYLGGGFGGLYTGHVSISGGAVGIRVDTIANGGTLTNQQLFLSNSTVLDSQTSAGLFLNETSSGSNITFNGWCSATVGASQGCIDIINWGGGFIQIGGTAQFISNRAAGILDSDSTTSLLIDASALFELNGSYGVFCSVSTSGINTAFIGISNTSGDLGANCHGQKFSHTTF